MTRKRDGAPELSWLAERWAAAMAAALNERGVAVVSHDWRPIGDWSSLDAGSPGTLWWNDQVSAPSREMASVGIGPAAQSLLAGLAEDSGPDSQSVPRLVIRASEIFTGASGLAGNPPEPEPKRIAEASPYAVSFALDGDRALEVVLCCFPGADSTAVSAGAALFNGNRMGMLLKVEVPVTISLGKASLPLKDTLKLARGSVVELDRSFNDPVDLVVNGRIVARGDIVVVEEKYAVRIREIYRDESSQVCSGLGATA